MESLVTVVLMLTSHIYQRIESGDFETAIALIDQIENFSPFLPTLAFCCFQAGQFQRSADIYRSLNMEYEAANAYYLLGSSELAFKSLVSSDLDDRAIRLKAILDFEINGAVQERPPAEALVVIGCKHYRSLSFALARNFFLESARLTGLNPVLNYNIAVCDFRLGKFESAQSRLDMTLQFAEVEDFLKDAAMNLKLAIHVASGMETDNLVSHILSKPIESLDQVSLNNLCITSADDDDTLNRLKFLINSTVQDQSLQVVFYSNLLQTLIMRGMMVEATDVLAQSAACLTDAEFEYWEGILMSSSNPQPLLAIFDKHIAGFAKGAETEMSPQFLVINFLTYFMIHQFLSVRDFRRVDEIFEKTRSFLSHREEWQICMAQKLYAQGRYAEAINIYSRFSQRKEVAYFSPSVLANFIVSYVLVGENYKGEELIRLVETELSQGNYIRASVVDLTIGTLYCLRGNWDFGLSRILRTSKYLFTQITLQNHLTKLFVLALEFIQIGSLSDTVFSDLAEALKEQRYRSLFRRALIARSNLICCVILE
jgi:tetratricopeptide repeat protein 30